MESRNYYEQLGNIIKELREKQNMTKTQLAQHICSVSYITRIENGERCPNSVILRQLTNKLGVEPDYLFRVIESPTGLYLKKFLNQLIFYIERDDFKSMYKLVNSIEEKKLEILSVYDSRLIRVLKCISRTMLTHNYEWGLKEIEDILKLYYSKEITPTYAKFTLMFHYGFFLLLNNQKEEAYEHLLKIKKHIDNIEHVGTHAIFPKYYVYLVSACLDTSNFNETLLYLDEAISYCKKHNVHTLLRELYFLKGELYYRLNDEIEFKKWYDKSLTLYELTKNSDDEYFKTFIKNRLNKLKN